VRVFAPAYRSAARDRARDGLTLAAELAAAYGVSLLLETSPGTIAPSTAQARALVDGFPPEHVGVLYNPGNMAIEGHVDPALVLDELGRTSTTSM
jgi:sugar phosphate isomerase/epimerase